MPYKDPAKRLAYHRNYYKTHKDTMRAQIAEWQQAHPDLTRAYQKRWRVKNPDQYIAAIKEWREKNPDRVRTHKRTAHLKQYNLTQPEYEAMLKKQGGVCAICKQPPATKRTGAGWRNRLAIDHDHTTGKIRGLLCDLCNQGLGCLGDSLDGLQRAITYLESACA